MIHAEISVYPMATKTTSASFYIAKALESVGDIDGIKTQLTPMGTIIESADIDKVGEATKRMLETVHNLGVDRVEAVIKIDSRRDKDATLQEKMDAVRRHLESS